MELRLIIDVPATGAWNMSLDEALLDQVSADGQAGCLRFYFWSQPTLSLGYFQSHSSRVQHRFSQACPLVRRSTGGGAIVHAEELTYSLVLPVRQATQVTSLYGICHETLISELSTRGIGASRWGQACVGSRDGEPFLCFLRRTADDIVFERHKIAGSAQRRRRGAVLQHGSVLLRKTSHAPELAGIEDLSAVQIDPYDLARRWSARIADCLGCGLRVGRPTRVEMEQARRYQSQKFGTCHWTHRR